VPVRFVGIRDTYMEAGPVEELMEKHGFASSHIVSAARAAVAAKRKG
jgi:transketolase C-terminal domain/subunit